MYEGDAPLAERRAAALSLDPALLAELLGTVELRELLDPEVVGRDRAILQRLDPDREARGVEGVADLLRDLGPLTGDEVAARVESRDRCRAALAELVDARRAGAGAIRRRASGSPPSKTLSRLRDALGVPIPPGVPEVFVEPVRDPLGDLVAASPARTGRSPCTTWRAGSASARSWHPSRSAGSGPNAAWSRASSCRTAPASSGATAGCSGASAAARSPRSATRSNRSSRASSPDSCRGGSRSAGDSAGSTASRRSSSSSRARAFPHPRGRRSCCPPASPTTGRRCSTSSPHRARCSGPGRGRSRATTAGSACTSPRAPNSRCRRPTAAPLDPLESELIAILGGGGGFFFRQLADASAPKTTAPIDALWRLVWAGLVTNDTFAPVRGLLAGAERTAPPRQPRGRGCGRIALAPVDRRRACRPTAPRGEGEPAARVAGRWSVLPLASTAATPRAHALGETLLERYGVVTRGSVMAEGVVGGFALAYRTLAGFEDSGRVRRGYFIDGQGGAQFATSAAVDRLRSAEGPDARARGDRSGESVRRSARMARPIAEVAHRPARKSGAFVAIVDGEAVLYLERGGRTALVFTDDAEVLAAATAALAATLRGGAPSACASSRSTASRCSARCSIGRCATRVSVRRRGGSASMPEGDTVYRVARSLDAALAGRVVTSTDFRVPAIATVDLAGEPFHSVASRGKHLLMRIGEWWCTRISRWRGNGGVRRPGSAGGGPAGRRARSSRCRASPPSASTSAPSRCSRRPKRPTGSITSAPTCSAPTGTPTRRSAASRRTRRPDRGRARRAAQPRRARQRLRQRAVLPQGHPADEAGR